MRPPFLSVPPMRYPNAYVWLVFISAMDVFLTKLVLDVWKGYEANPIADAVISHLGFGWTVVFKLTLIMLVIIICEVVGRYRDLTGRRLAIASVIISALPVVYTFALMIKTDPVGN